jgi:hypothetical protein
MLGNYPKLEKESPERTDGAKNSVYSSQLNYETQIGLASAVWNEAPILGLPNTASKQETKIIEQFSYHLTMSQANFSSTYRNANILSAQQSKIHNVCIQ